MNIFTWLGPVVGCLILTVAIAGALVIIWHRPTVEYVYLAAAHKGRSVTGWRRAVVLGIGAPVVGMVFLLRTVGLFRDGH